MRWAPNLDALLLSYQRTGNVPPALASRPTLTPDVSYLLECFSLLSRHRQSNGFGSNPLALADIVAVAAPLGFRTNDEFLFFAEVMGGMDDEFLTFHQEQRTLKANIKKPR